MLAALGMFIFETGTLPFGEVSRRQDWRHEAARRVGARDASQYTGPGDDLVTLSGVLAPAAEIGSYDSLEQLREMAEAGEEYELLDGTGRVWGGFVILALDTRRKHIMIDGTPRLTDFAIDLRRVS